MSKLLLQVVVAIVTAIKEVCGGDTAKQVVDAAFDKIENRVAESANKFDDALILPILKTIREKLNIPDNDETSESAQADGA